MRTLGGVPWLAIALTLASAPAASAGCATPTEIFACYGVDPSLALPGGTLRVRAETSDGTLPLYASDIGSLTTTFASQGFVRRNHDGVRITLEATVPYASGDRIVTQDARIAFQQNRIVDVTLWIESSCTSVTCLAAETCVAGRCESIDVDATCLADHGVAGVPSCTDPRVRRACRAPDPADGGR